MYESVHIIRTIYIRVTIENKRELQECKAKNNKHILKRIERNENRHVR